MKLRRGLGRGKGMGYKNILTTDRKVHYESAKGMKQPQWVTRVMLSPHVAIRGLTPTQKKRLIERVKKKGFPASMNYREAELVAMGRSGKYAEKSACPTFHKLSKVDKMKVMSKVSQSGLRGIKALEYAEVLSITMQQARHEQRGGKDPSWDLPKVKYIGKSGKDSEPKGTPSERIIRLHQDGYSDAAIALKTGMPIKYVVTITDRIAGGLADGKPDSDFDMTELKKGINVEMEHTEDSAVAKEIAKDHLTEDKEYYKKLAKMEAGDTPAPRARRAAPSTRPERVPNPSLTNYTVGDAFLRGDRGGHSLHMRIHDTPTETLLVGYGWAVYGARDKATGEVTFYKGWDGYSHTTSKQISQAGLRTGTRVENRRRQFEE